MSEYMTTATAATQWFKCWLSVMFDLKTSSKLCVCVCMFRMFEALFTPSRTSALSVGELLPLS